jgi:hypothetical protein
MFEGMDGFSGTVSDVFINLSQEYPAILDGVLYLFAGLGVIIAATACLDIVKLGKTNNQVASPAGAIAAKIVGGVGLVDLSVWAQAWSATLWANDNPLGISDYVVSNNSDDYATSAALAALGFIVIAGYVVLGRAYLMITKLGYLSPDARSDMVGNILARIFAGSAMVSALHVARAINNSAGLSLIPV